MSVPYSHKFYGLAKEEIRMYKCRHCGKEFEPPRYYWKGLSGEYCSKECATHHPKLPELIKDEI